MAKNLWAHEEWQRFRQRALSFDNFQCTRCSRTHPEVVLQVHHKQYIKGLLPWEYELKDCLTLCKGCHAREHGLIRPDTGWILSDIVDLGEVIGDCDLCHRKSHYRHQYTIYHPAWGYMDVGSSCVLELTDESKALLTEYQKQRERLERFVANDQWLPVANGYRRKKHKGHLITIWENKSKFRSGFYYKVSINRNNLKPNFNTLDEAKVFAFKYVDH